jgi:hypothetical protein
MFRGGSDTLGNARIDFDSWVYPVVYRRHCVDISLSASWLLVASGRIIQGTSHDRLKRASSKSPGYLDCGLGRVKRIIMTAS